MSMRRDFNMYYESTLVGIRKEDGTVNPFYIFGTSGNRDSDTERHQLSFSGYEVTDAQGHRTDKVVNYNDLVFELPPLGYVTSEGGPHWMSYCQRKTVKKGICSARVSEGRNIRWDDRLFWQFYHPTIARLNRDFLIHDGAVHYKGNRIGTHTAVAGIVLNLSAEYLLNRLQELITCPLILETPQE